MLSVVEKGGKAGGLSAMVEVPISIQVTAAHRDLCISCCKEAVMTALRR